MATLNDPNIAANVARVGEVAAGVGGALDGLHFTPRGIPTSIGHYRATHRCALVNSQAANSRLFELRNTHASNLIIPYRLRVRWMQIGAHTAAIEDSLDLYRATSFSAVDTTNTVTPTPSIVRAGMTAVPGNAALRGVTVAGAAAGMTGGTLTKDTGPLAQLPQWLLAAMPTGSSVYPADDDLLALAREAHPLVLAQNEGIVLENRVALGAAAASSVYIDIAWAEVAAY